MSNKKRCNKYGFETGKEFLNALEAEGVDIMGFRGEANTQTFIDYFNQEIETNFNHYIKEYSEILKKRTINNIKSTISIANYLKALKPKGVPFKDWLNQEYKP